MNFSFSYIGLIFLLMLMVPNILWSRRKPKDYDKYQKNENRVLVLLERVGEVLVACTSLLFGGSEVPFSPWSLWLAVACILMALYEAYWARYFKSGRTMEDFYCNFLHIPVAGATLPVAAFLLLGIYGKNIPLIISVAILGIGHIGIHLIHQREVREV